MRCWRWRKAWGYSPWRYIQNKKDPTLSDPRTFVKAHLLNRLLRSVPVEKLRPAIETTYSWQTWIDTMRQTLMDHYAQGHHIVIASGALDLYLPQLTKDLPHNALVCTKIEVIDGVITGVMTNWQLRAAAQGRIGAQLYRRPRAFCRKLGLRQLSARRADAEFAEASHSRLSITILHRHPQRHMA